MAVPPLSDTLIESSRRSRWRALVPRRPTPPTRADVGLVAFLLLVVALHGRLYHDYPYKPIAPATGWENFWDQGLYLKSARAFARGDLSADQHWYPIGYALLAAPFVDLFPLDPFLVVNVASLLVFAGAFLLYFRPVIGLVPTATAFIASLALPAASYVTAANASHPIWVQFVVPWNTIPIAATYLWVMCLLREPSGPRRPRRDAALGALAAATVVIRPTDVLALIPIGVVYLWRRVRSERPLLHVRWAAGAAAAVLVPAVIVTLVIHGGLRSPYVGEATAIGMSLSDIHERAHAILLSAAPTFGEIDTAVFELQPWLYLAFPLAIVWAVRDTRVGLVPVATALASLVVYLSFNDFWPFNLIRFSLIHYIVWLLPVIGAAGIAGGVLLVRTRQWAPLGLVTAASLVLACYRVEPRVVATDAIRVAPAGDVTTYTLSFAGPRELDAIDLAGATGPDPINLTWERIRFVADGEVLDRFTGYRLIQINGGIRVILNRHISARHVEFDLGSAIQNRPDGAGNVRPLRFHGTFMPFWRPKQLAAIG